ncbi:hypothetical protein [Streptomyces sp. NPDC002690]
MVADGVGRVQPADPVSGGLAVVAEIEPVPAHGLREFRAQGVQPHVERVAVPCLLDEVGDRAQQGVEYGCGVLAFLGGLAGEAGRGNFERSDEFFADELASVYVIGHTGRRVGRCPGAGQSYESGARDCGHDDAAGLVHGRSHCLSQRWNGGPEFRQFGHRSCLLPGCRAHRVLRNAVSVHAELGIRGSTQQGSKGSTDIPVRPPDDATLQAGHDLGIEACRGR